MAQSVDNPATSEASVRDLRQLRYNIPNLVRHTHIELHNPQPLSLSLL